MSDVSKTTRDRPAQNPGGCECEVCGCTFIGEPWHGRCAVCVTGPAPSQITRRFADRFPNHPEAIASNVSEAFLDLLGHVHPDQDYPSEEAASLCRYAYDLGRKEGAENAG